MARGPGLLRLHQQADDEATRPVFQCRGVAVERNRLTQPRPTLSRADN